MRNWGKAAQETDFLQGKALKEVGALHFFPFTELKKKCGRRKGCCNLCSFDFLRSLRMTGPRIENEAERAS